MGSRQEEQHVFFFFFFLTKYSGLLQEINPILNYTAHVAEEQHVTSYDVSTSGEHQDFHLKLEPRSLDRSREFMPPSERESL
jgi:hypothetical protein